MLFLFYDASLSSYTNIYTCNILCIYSTNHLMAGAVYILVSILLNSRNPSGANQMYAVAYVQFLKTINAE